MRPKCVKEHSPYGGYPFGGFMLKDDMDAVTAFANDADYGSFPKHSTHQKDRPPSPHQNSPQQKPTL